MGRQKLESRTSAETGNDSPYLEDIIHQIKYFLKQELMSKSMTTHFHVQIKQHKCLFWGGRIKQHNLQQLGYHTPIPHDNTIN